MYTEPGFYYLKPNAIGTLQYKKNMAAKMSDEERQKFIDRSSNERMRAFMMNTAYGMNANGPTNPFDAYVKSRRDSFEELESGNIANRIEMIMVQIDQKESYDVICNIEKMEDFSGWLDPTLVNLIKDQYLNINK